MEPITNDLDFQAVLGWCTTIVGPFEIVSGDPRHHGRTSVCRLQTEAGHCYLKIHREADIWAREAHGYERWAPAFGSFAPHLLAVHQEEPLALLVDELSGQVLEDAKLPVAQERAAWRAAGQALASLHSFEQGDCFGPCDRDGSCLDPVDDAVSYVSDELARWAHQAVAGALLDDLELAVVRSAQGMTQLFAGERPVPCHRDYCPYNWLVDQAGAWTGVIDFEFAYWDVRVADFSRYPDWEWMERPDLLEALFEGYGRTLTPREEEQRLVAHVQYALSAIVWGHEHAYYGFEEEGRRALRHLATLLS